MMKRFFSYVLVSLISIFCTIVYFYIFSDKGKEPISTEIIKEAISPDSVYTALLLYGRTGETDYLGSEHRYYLGFRKDDTEFILTRELTGGFGHYETSIDSIRWIDNSTILVERILADKKMNVSFDIKNFRWSEY